MFLNHADDRTYTLRDMFKIHGFWISLRQPVFCGMFNIMINPGRPDQGFAGYTAIVQTVAAKGRLFFHQECLGPELGGTGGNGKPGCTATQYTKIKIIICHVLLLVFLK